MTPTLLSPRPFINGLICTYCRRFCSVETAIRMNALTKQIGTVTKGMDAGG